MTGAFELFMREHGATGSEKADGYSPNAFIGLTEREREIAFDLLLTELPWSARWLFVLDAEIAAVVAREKEEELRQKEGADVYMLQQQLVTYTGDLVYQKNMIEDYPTYRHHARPLIVDAVNRTPTNQAKIDFFKRVLWVEVNESALARAARHLLDAVKFPSVTDADKASYSRLVTDLRSDSTAVKEKAFREIEEYERTVLSGDGTS